MAKRNHGLFSTEPRVVGEITAITETDMSIKVGSALLPCTYGMFQNIRAHFSRGDQVIVEMSSEGQVKSIVKKGPIE